MIYTSNWKLTLGTGSVLLNFGSQMPSEIKSPLRNPVDEVRSPDSDFPLLLDLKNSAFTIKFGIYSSYVGDREARAGLLDSLILRSSETISTCRIDVNGYTDRYWSIAQCRASEFDPEVVYLPVLGTRLLRSYTLICAGIIRNGP